MKETLKERTKNDLVTKLWLKKETKKLALEREQLKAEQRATAVREKQEFVIKNMENKHKLHQAKKMTAYKLKQAEINKRKRK